MEYSNSRVIQSFDSPIAGRGTAEVPNAIDVSTDTNYDEALTRSISMMQTSVM